MSNLLRKAFSIQPEEAGLVVRFFLFFAGIGALYTVGATVGDTLFLSSLAPEQVPALLPWVYVGIAVANVTTTFVFDEVQARFSRHTAIIGTQVFLGVTVLLSWQLVSYDSYWVYFGLVIWLEACALLSITLFYSFAGDYFTARDARRLYGFIAGGMAAGTVISGYLIRATVSFVGTRNLLLVCGAVLLINAAIAFSIFRTGKRRETDDEQEGSGGTERVALRVIFARPYVRMLALVIPLSLVMAVAVDYQMKWVASSKTEEELAQFFGTFFGAVGIAQIVFQFLVVPRLLTRLGILNCLVILPALVGAAGLVMLAGSMFGYWGYGILAFSAGINFIRVTLAETLDLPSRELLFVPLPTRIRVRAQPLMGGALAPLSQGLGGVLLLIALFAGVGVDHLGVIVVGCAILLILALVRLRPLYRDTLAATLRDHQLEETDVQQLMQTGGADQMINALLRSPDSDVVKATLELTAEQELGELAPILEELVQSEDAQVAIIAIERLAAENDRRYRGAIEKAWDSPNANVRSAAVLALCQVAGGDALEEVSNRMDVFDPDMRASAVIGLARHGGESGESLARPQLEGMSDSPLAKDRVEAASMLGRIGAPGYADLLQKLIADESPQVRAAAAEACAQVSDPELVPILLNVIHTPGLRAAALRGLTATPPDAIDPIVEIMRNPDTSTGERCAMARVLSGVGGYPSLMALWEVTGTEEDLALKLSAAEGLQAIMDRVPAMRMTLEGFEERVEAICARIELLGAALRQLDTDEAFIRDLFKEHARMHADLLFAIFVTHYDPQVIGRIQHNIFREGGGAATDALELFDEVLPRKLGRVVVAALQTLMECGDLPPGEGFSDATRSQLLGADAWIRAATVRHLNQGAAYPTIEAAALDAQDQELYRHLDIVSFLKQVPLFRDVQAYHLVEQAEIAEWVSLAQDQVLFYEGDEGDALYIVCGGEVRIVHDGEELACLGRGECLGEMALLDGEPRSAGGVAVHDDTMLLRFAADRFQNLLISQPTIARAMLQTLERRIRSTQGGDAPAPAPEPASRRSQFMRARKLGLRELVSTMSFLRQVELFADMPASAMANVAGIAQEVTLYEGDTLFEQGDGGESLYLVCSGEVAIEVDEREVARLGKNACLGEMALISGLPRSATATATLESRMLRVGADDFMSLLTQEPEIALALLRTLAVRLRTASVTEVGKRKTKAPPGEDHSTSLNT